MKYRNTEYMITDQRIIILPIGPDTRFLDLHRIQEVYVEVGFIDKMFGTGTVHATTAGYDTSILASLKEPYEVQKLLQVAVASSVMYCSKCGAAIPTDSKVCPYCGHTSQITEELFEGTPVAP